MAKKSATGPQGEGPGFPSVNSWSFVVLSICLVLAGGVAGSGLVNLKNWRSSAARSGTTQPDKGGPAPKDVPAWGELMTTDIWMERPEEYVAFEAGTNQPAEWFFDQRTPQEVHALMLASGLNAGQADRLMMSGRVLASSAGTRVQPGDDAVFSLEPKIRAALYRAQPKNEANRYVAVPFHFQGQYVEEWLTGSGLEEAAVAQFKKLVYPSGRLLCFSDVEVMLRTLPTERQRLALLKAVSRQPAVLVRVRVRPDTDVDKLVGYWTPGVRVKDVRPLLQSLTRLPDGGSVSLMYLLPPFARDRVFTFPAAPAGRDETVMDCHWSAMNFFNEKPDNRFSDQGYVMQQVQTNYYTIAKPTLCGDLVLVIRGGTNVLHSAVFLADDIAFTKNGNNVNQPWTTMRMKDLLATYAKDDTTELYFYRRKDR